MKDCDGICIDSDGDLVCNVDEVYGCTDPDLFNYDVNATEDNGSCEAIVLGCTDQDALNYDQSLGANTDDGSCNTGPWDVIINASCNVTILFQGDDITSISVEGELLTNIWVGAINTDGVIVGSMFWDGETESMSVNGEDSGPGEFIPGMTSGESLNFVIWDEDLQETIPVNATYLFGSDVFGCYDLTAIETLEATSIIYQDIELSTGWGIWSTHISPAESDSMQDIFSDVVDNLVIVKNQSGQVYWPLFQLNSIGVLTDGQGYQAKMEADDTLTIEGALVPSDTNIPLTSGWGIMGYLPLDSLFATDVMVPIVEDLIIVKNESGQVYWPQFSLNSIGYMKAGKGYQIKMTNSITFNYPSNSRYSYVEEVLATKTSYYDVAPNTGNNMIIGLPLTSWEVMPAIGDEIAAYDESGRLIGSTSFNGDNIALTVWGDDFTTDAKDGLATGEKVTFKLWNSDMNTESTLVVAKWDTGSDIYTVDGISIASIIVLSGSVSADAYKLYQNVPNPFNGTTTIKFYVPESTNVTIGVYNMLGEYVAEVTSDMFNTGKHEVVFDGSDLGQGTYFVRMNTAGFTATKSMNLVK